jgi:hypothetical protein
MSPLDGKADETPSLTFEAAFCWFHYLTIQASHVPCDVRVEGLYGVIDTRSICYSGIDLRGQRLRPEMIIKPPLWRVR